MSFFIALVIIFNGLIIFFFSQAIIYGIFSYFRFWRKRKNISFEKILYKVNNDICKLPKITLIVPAKNEANVISATIDALMNLNYPKDRYNLLVVLDEKEQNYKEYNQTTRFFVDEKEKYYNKQYKNSIIVTAVPKSFNGSFPGKILSKTFPSTKPRALNWALGFIPQDTDIVGFYDADSRPEKDILIYVAEKYLSGKSSNLLLQGPVVQVRNYFNIGVLNKIYALLQGITHEYFLPVLLSHLPFIGGTNFYISRKLLLESKGFNRKSLSEDLDFGCRLYLEFNVWPEFLPYVATEQTPPDYKGYFCQRTRWARGYIQVIERMFKVEGNFLKRAYLLFMLIFYGVLPWIITQVMILSGIGILFLSFFGFAQIYKSLPIYIKYFAIICNFAYFSFIIYYFIRSTKRFYIPIKLTNKDMSNLRYIVHYIELLAFPFAAVLASLPYTYGFIVAFFNNNFSQWIKTPRTKE